ncbi:hypothetical protein POKO110462_12545 [Pontibacter korlensis]
MRILAGQRDVLGAQKAPHYVVKLLSYINKLG